MIEKDKPVHRQKCAQECNGTASISDKFELCMPPTKVSHDGDKKTSQKDGHVEHNKAKRSSDKENGRGPMCLDKPAHWDYVPTILRLQFPATAFNPTKVYHQQLQKGKQNYAFIQLLERH
mmetsp:Transcript_53488/g.95972  ORF Transcript_53488/g.95972 Transcript_53488/m.95972 type:complete len:120 (-) Transcript_53488:161-520(-)